MPDNLSEVLSLLHLIKDLEEVINYYEINSERLSFEDDEIPKELLDLEQIVETAKRNHKKYFGQNSLEI